MEYTFGATAEAAFSAYDARDEPYWAVFLFSDAVFSSGDGSEPGEEPTTSGAVTDFTLYDHTAGILLTGPDLNGDLPDFLSFRAQGGGLEAMHALYAEGIVLVGSDLDRGNFDNWQGDLIQTGGLGDVV